MGVLRYLWSGVLAFDRVGRRIPQLIQIWLGELFLVMPLAFFIGKVIDIRGAFGVPGTGGSIPGVFWGALAVAAVAGFFFVRGLLRPRVVEGSWAPVSRLPIGDVDVMVANNRARVSYDYLTSHPSYALLLLLTAPIPATMVLATRHQGDSTFYFRVAGIAGLVIIASMAVARLLAWYVFRFGRDRLTSVSPRAAWEIAWKPVLMLVVICYAIVGIPLAVMFVDEHRTIERLPVATTAVQSGSYVRVRGTVVGDPVYWAPNGTGRGGDNYAGAGILVDLDGGDQALLLAESMAVPDFRGALEDVRDGRIRTQGKVIDAVTEDQRTYYGFDLADFGDPPDGGRVLVLLGQP